VSVVLGVPSAGAASILTKPEIGTGVFDERD
jgi:hypothetical protein